ncbi:MAG: NAD(P)/FAD-dependent oxidoreductase [Candidatus Thermoplasmatota archaeon]|nr:NAD(P)/FAD-dependent oxidoreductase [Candidatus Thermoplasmatota archaeon]
MKNYQVAIIGGGVIGSALAWELSQYKINVVVFEAGSDVASGTSKANSGVIHSGINSPPSSLKARFCVEGNTMFQSLATELGFPLKWIGKYVIAKNEDEIKELERLKTIGHQNKVAGLKIQDGSLVKKKEPNISCIAALWVPTAGIITPYEFTIALAENAVENNVRFFLETKVTYLKRKDHHFVISTNKGEFEADVVVNAAGLNCREIVSMIEAPDFQVYPCRGEYLVLDKIYDSLVQSMVYPVPIKELGVLGVHITPTIDGNILLGPSAEFLDDSTDTSTTKEMMKTLLQEAREIIPTLPENATINAYAGIRCKLSSPRTGGWTDYRVEESKHIAGLIHLLGIESPGLTAAPAIAKEVTRMISHWIKMEKKTNIKIRTVHRKRFSQMSIEEQSAMIQKDERWGRIVCRCEQITEAEVIEALSNPLKAQTFSSVKYRCRAGMGRCQGGFCTQHIIRIMEQQLHMDVTQLKLKSPNSPLFTGKVREAKQ